MSKFIKTRFFHPSPFSLLTKQKGGKLKSFLSSHFAILPLFFILPPFHPSNQTNPYICSQSDVFVAAIFDRFYSNVVDKRIATTWIQTLVPANIRGYSDSASDFITPYVTNKNPLAYSCFCQSPRTTKKKKKQPIVAFSKNTAVGLSKKKKQNKKDL